MKILPRFIRFRDAPTYLGMDRNRFNAEVRGSLTEIPIGIQGVAFDRLELDAWAEQHKSRQRASRSSERSFDMGRKRTPGLVFRYGVWRIDKHIGGRRVAKALERLGLEESGTLPRPYFRGEQKRTNLRSEADANFRAGRGEVRAGERAQASSATTSAG